MEMMNTASAFQMQQVQRYWGWFLALGVIDGVLGVLCLSSTVFATLLTTVFLGILAVIGGVVLVATAFWALSTWSMLLRVALGVLLVLAGWSLLTRPVVGALTLTALIAWYFLITGALQLIMSAVERAPGWGWEALNGAINLLLGVLLLVNWPSTGLIAIGLFLGINLLINGILWISASLRARSAVPPTAPGTSAMV